MTDKLYCTVKDLVNDLQLSGAANESQLLDYIRAASAFVSRKIGYFIPQEESRWYDGNGLTDMFIDPVLSIDSMEIDGTVVVASNYILSGANPRMPYWENGPYNLLTVDPDATQIATWLRELDSIQITGKWGLHSATESTGATVQNTTEITAGGTSLVVGNGATISPGMVLSIESEQILVTATGAVTDSTANLNGAIDSNDDTFNVTDGTKINVGEVIRIDLERMLVLDIATNAVYVARGWQGSARASHVDTSDVYAFRTFTVKRAVNGTTAAAHANGTAISQYVAPFDVIWLTRQIAGLMKKKAESGFAGKTGNVELGEIFYHEEFPKSLYETVRANYSIRRL